MAIPPLAVAAVGLLAVGAFAVNEGTHGGLAEGMGMGHHHLMDHGGYHCADHGGPDAARHMAHMHGGDGPMGDQDTGMPGG